MDTACVLAIITRFRKQLRNVVIIKASSSIIGSAITKKMMNGMHTKVIKLENAQGRLMLLLIMMFPAIHETATGVFLFVGNLIHMF